MATPYLCSQYSPSKQKYVEVSVCLKSDKISLSKCLLKSFKESKIGTLVNKDTISKLTIKSPGWILMEFKV